MRSRTRLLTYEALEERLALRIFTTVPLQIAPNATTTSQIDSSGTEYRLIIYNGQSTGSLSRCIYSDCESISSVRNFEIRGDRLSITFGDGTTSDTQLRGDVTDNVLMRALAESPNAAIDAGSVRGIVGNVATELDLIARYGSPLVPRALLDSVGRIDSYDIIDGPDARNMIGSGTLLAYGGNRYVLTAAHVVEDSTSGKQVPASDLSFVIQGDRRGFSPHNFGVEYRVKYIFGRSYFQQDLALLELERPVPNVQGAYLPGEGFSAQVGQQIMAVGFGYDDQDKTGIRNFGFTRIDKRENADEQVDKFRATGEHLVYKFDQGEAAIAQGDSGGPDFIVLDQNKQHLVPQVAGVHSYIKVAAGGHSPEIEDTTHSVAITSRHVEAIKRAIPYTFQSVIDFGIHIYEDGDSNISGGGEWVETFKINGDSSHELVIANVVYDGSEFWTITNLPLNSVETIAISLSGYEQDDGLFTGDNDTIPRYDGVIYAPHDRLPGHYPGRSGRVYGDISYEILWRIDWDWVKVNRMVSVPQYRGVTTGTSSGEDSVSLTRSLWKNSSNAMDVSGDGFVTPLDALIPINQINAKGTGVLRSVYDLDAVSAFFDTNGDGSLSPLDSLLVINFLNGNSLVAAGEGRWTPNSIADSLGLKRSLAVDLFFANQIRFDDRWRVGDSPSVTFESLDDPIIDTDHASQGLEDFLRNEVL